MASARIVVDTNVLISRALLPKSVSAQAVRRAVDRGVLLMSEATLAELAEVLARPKFDAYVSASDRRAFFSSLVEFVEIVPITTAIRACRDPRDDKFLDLAVSGDAGWLVTGDQDLLVLNPYAGIAIVTPAGFLASPA